MIKNILFPSNQRPKILKEALVSFNRYLKKSGSPAKVTILDDSRDSAAVTANRDLAESLSGNFSGGLRIVGRVERAALAGGFQGASQGSALDFALGLCGTGAAGYPGGNRNAGLLLYAGQKILSMDDDVRFNFLRFRKADILPENEDGVPLLLPLGSLKRLEKLTVPAVWNPEDLENRLGSKPEATEFSGAVKLAMAGIWGGRWYSNPFSFCAVPPHLSEKIWHGKKEYQSARTAPWALMLSPGIRYSGASFFVSTCFAYDSAELLPPFFPGIRSSDSLWAWMLRVMYPESPICHLPLAIEHDRSIKQPFTYADFTGITPGASGIIMKLLGFLRAGFTGIRDSASLADSLGTGLSRFAAEPVRRRHDLLSELYLSALGGRIGAFEELLEESRGKPRFWADDLKTHCEQLHREACEARPWLPREFRNASTEKEGEESFRVYLDRCGELLCSWPEIWQKAEERSLSGEFLS